MKALIIGVIVVLVILVVVIVAVAAVHAMRNAGVRVRERNAMKREIAYLKSVVLAQQDALDRIDEQALLYADIDRPLSYSVRYEVSKLKEGRRKEIE